VLCDRSAFVSGRIAGDRVGVQGAVAINTLLRRPQDADAARQFCVARQSEALEDDAVTAAAYYRQQAQTTPAPFWLARAAGEAVSPEVRSDFPAPTQPLALALSAAIVQEPVAEGAFITRRPALRHPGLRRPMAFVRNVPVSALIPQGEAAQSAQDMMRRWLVHLTERDVGALLAMFWRRGILVPAR